MMRLLEKVCEYSEDPGLSEGLAIDMPTVIIGQFRFLDYIVASRQVCLKIFEIIDIAEEPLQRELISVLPEVLNDQQHEDAALHLK